MIFLCHFLLFLYLLDFFQVFALVFDEFVPGPMVFVKCILVILWLGTPAISMILPLASVRDNQRMKVPHKKIHLPLVR